MEDEKKKPNPVNYGKLAFHYLISNAMYLVLVPLIAILFSTTHLSEEGNFVHYYNHELNLVSATACIAVTVFLVALYFMCRPRQVYLLDFACYKPDKTQMCTKEFFLKRSELTGSFSEESMAFQRKIMERSGYGQKTYGSKSLMEIPGIMSVEEARKEAEMLIFGAVDELLAKTRVNVKDIGILIVNSSLFNPTPSLSAMVVHRYKLRGNVLSYSLGGMGCSAGLISLDLAKRLLQVEPNTYALIVSMEGMNLNWYGGNNRSMLITNCLFRLGAAAILLTNRVSDRGRSKYQLVHSLRTHMGADDKCYNCVLQKEDPEKRLGVQISKDLLSAAGEALKTHITTLGPLVLPISEQLLFLLNLVGRKVFNMRIQKYVPDFKMAFEHFCIHAGGRAVLDELEKNLGLTESHMEPSRMTLYRFGNTSSSSSWYVLAYCEAAGRIKRGDRVWQIAFGSGFKCNSAVWRALRTVDPAKDEHNPWTDEIDEFPVPVPDVASIVY
ncbi:3-ketoacyl-CoA synthase 11-like [Corylus avellana]|uniref:3-ketoacyl-CoA synthase 11-like n=1 Tax=Corylus avellana TaxID=13451 RepID=UPI001E2332BE|nr:3-ketoacyl-CoA synthase 11-like [Corylus avellana]